MTVSAWKNSYHQAAFLINLIPSSEIYNYTAAPELQKIECVSHGRGAESLLVQS